MLPPFPPRPIGAVRSSNAARAGNSSDLADLPAPDAAAAEHSARLVDYIRQLIADRGGWIPFSDYMRAALYAPGLGYYTAGATKFGAAGDFVTAPEISPLFGRTVATQCRQILELTGGDILELGAGTGRLAADMLGQLERDGALPARYAILEPSPDLQQRQQAWLAQQVPALLPRVEWLQELPAAWTGIVVANEVLDAVPCELVERRDGAWLRCGVAVDDEQLVRADRPLEEPLHRVAEARFPSGGDYRSELNPEAEALVATLAARLRHGVLLWIDYGFPRGEYYHPQRDTGTLVGHYRQRVLDAPLLWPGLQDLTAHVDFTAVVEAGSTAGLDLVGYTTQASFLLNCGITGLLGEIPPDDAARYLPLAAGVQKLLSPAEMGELFKVMALSRGITAPLLGFFSGDRSHRL